MDSLLIQQNVPPSISTLLRKIPHLLTNPESKIIEALEHSDSIQKFAVQLDLSGQNSPDKRFPI